MPYPDRYNEALLDRIPLDARTVLDVGCATGALGFAYKQRNPRARVLGIERDPETAALARTRLDEVAIVDVEREPFPFAGPSVDCIVYGDSLEHLVDPWRVLSEQTRHLHADGLVLICVPNVQHWSFAERLLRGTFDYEPQGLFDRTHLRWFTADMMRRAIHAADLLPLDVSARIFDASAADAFAGRIAPALANLGIDRATYLNQAAPLQFVWRARRATGAPARPSPTLTIVSTMLAPIGGVSDVRVVEPLRALATDPSVHARLAADFDEASLLLDAPKIYILHRPALDGIDALGPVRRLIALGYVVVCEFDDHPDHIPAVAGMDLQNFAAVHAVQTTTEPLAVVLRARNPEVAVFPNAAPRLREPRNFTGDERITLFFGALNREADWAPFMPTLNEVARAAGRRLAFQVVSDRAFFDALETPDKRFTPLCRYELYLDILARSDVCFMPLLDTPFNRCKSDLKFVEASALRVATLASRTVYGASVEDGASGLIFDTPDTLRAHLVGLIADPGKARRLAEAARDQVASHRMLADQTAARIAWYRSLWDRRDDLNRALLARVPSLA